MQLKGSVMEWTYLLQLQAVTLHKSKNHKALLSWSAIIQK